MVGSAWMPWLRPMVRVYLCSKARAPAPPAPRRRRQQQVGGLGELDGEAGVQHVAAGHALVHEAAVRPDRLGEPGQEGDDVVPGLALDRVDALEIGRRDRGQLGARPSRGWCARPAPGWRRSRPSPRRPGPRSRTRSGSGSPAPRWRPSRVACSGEPCRVTDALLAGHGQLAAATLDKSALTTREERPACRRLLTAGPGRAGPGAAHRHRPGRRQRRRGGMAVAGLPAHQKRPAILAGHRRGHRHPHRLRRGHAAAAGDHRPAAGRRPAAAVGLLEDVPRAAPRPPPTSTWRSARQDAARRRCCRSSSPTSP